MIKQSKPKAAPLVYALLTLLALIPPAMAEDAISVKISSPSEGFEVGKGILVKGTARVPAAHHVWVFARVSGMFQDFWWPQREARIDPRTGAWRAYAYFGGPQDIGEEFEIAVAVFDEDAHRWLERYRKEAIRTEDWRPVELPLPAASPQVLTVRKVSHE